MTTTSLVTAFAHIFWLKVDAFVLIIWYGIAAWVSLAVARLLVHGIAALFFD